MARRALVLVLLAARFAVELALFAALGLLAAGLASGPAGWVLGLAAVLAVVALWGVLLSPRRRVDAPLAVRVGVELALVAVAGAGLAAAGHVVSAWLLVGTELVVVAGLWAFGLPPGSDAGTHPSWPEGPARAT